MPFAHSNIYPPPPPVSATKQNQYVTAIFTPWPFRPKGYCRCLRLSVHLSICKLFLVCTITLHRFELESPNLHHACILGYSGLVLKMEVIDLDLPRSFWQFWLSILGNLACPRDNSSQISTRITKLAPTMHLGILSAGIENEGHWPWHSRSFWQFIVKKRHSTLLLYLRSRLAKGSYTSQTCSC